MLRNTKTTNLAPADERRTRMLSPYSWFEEMDRWFEDFRREFESHFWDPLALRGSSTALRTRAPALDLADTGREFVVTAELPGVGKEDVDIQVDADGIEIRAETRGEKEEKEKGYYRRDRTYSAFHRVLPFPAEVIADQAEARLKDGLLEVRVPKKEATPTREPVKVRVE